MDGTESKRWESLLQRMQKQRERNWQVEGDLMGCRDALEDSRRQVVRLQEQLAQARGEIDKLKADLAELSAAVRGGPEVLPAVAATASGLPAFVKGNVVKEATAKKPGRKAGHAAAHRPLPEKIDVHIEVPLPRDGQGMASCPACHTQLSDVKSHERIVEDVVPAKLQVTCYHTASGYCPGCRKIVESRASEQPPAPPGVDIPQGQLGLNALATGALLRVQYRLPYRQISQLFLDLPELSISSGAVARQIQRMGHWLEGLYDRLKVLLRLSSAVHMDETGWRTDGQNGWLWTMLSDQHTLYHMDQSRGQKVVEELLGKRFAGTLISDFYGGYGKIDCKKQKCLTHLGRELRETAQKHPAFAGGVFHQRCKRLVKEMLLLKEKKGQMDALAYECKGKRLERRVLELARGSWEEPQAKRLAKRLERHAGELTWFLWHDEVDGTNNAAERAIRPAVVIRKISGGSRSQAGARATAILLSVLRTAQQQNRPLLETIKTLLMASWAGKNPGLLTDTLVDTS